MAKEILENEYEQLTNKQSSNILYRDQLEYTGSRIFWTAALGLSAITIYAALTYLVVQQLKK